MANAGGERVTDYPVSTVIDYTRLGMAQRNAASCMGCHDGRAMQAYDQVRSRYSEGSSDVTPAERDQILETYPGDSRMGEFVAEANRAYASALARVGQSSGEPEPVSAIYQEAGVGVFPDDIAAGQLFVSPDELRSAIAQLTPELLAVGPEEDSWLSSREYRQGYLRLLCGLQRQAQNVPVGCP